MQPIAVCAHIALSKPGAGLVVHDSNGHEVVDPRWVSLDVHVEVEMGDGSRLPAPGVEYALGGPIDVPRRELEERVRSVIFDGPRDAPPDPMDDLKDLPLTVVLDRDVEARLVE